MNSITCPGIKKSGNQRQPPHTGIALPLELLAMKFERIEHAKLGGLLLRSNASAHKKGA